jgi:hypothetical protein
MRLRNAFRRGADEGAHNDQYDQPTHRRSPEWIQLTPKHILRLDLTANGLARTWLIWAAEKQPADGLSLSGIGTVGGSVRNPVEGSRALLGQVPQICGAPPDRAAADRRIVRAPAHLDSLEQMFFFCSHDGGGRSCSARRGITVQDCSHQRP